MIVPMRLNVESTDGAWRLGRSKPGAADRLGDGFGQELEQLAAFIRGITPAE
ncbi:MAG: hypothetical protein GY945_12175 [Rhodobacteraceae bacterium]|nr:hypothetical protein [Paracoccaceae bacterium]